MDKIFKEYAIRKQYLIPPKLNYLAQYYKINWDTAQKLYALCVEETLVVFDAENIIDEKFSLGQGYHFTAKLFEEKLKKYFSTK